MILAIISIIVFIFVIVLIIKQPRIRIPKSKKSIQLDYGFAPLLGVGIILLSFQLDPSVLVRGIIGTPTIRPEMIIMLFFSLAYVCLSIDQTGLFEYLALTAAKKSGSSGKKLFFYIFLLSSVLTMFTSNDIVILTLTPIIVYFCKYTKANPIPYLIGQFFAANIWSVMLYIGNPTNIIVAHANHLTFGGYTAIMALPTIAAGLSCYALLWLLFRKQIPSDVSPPTIEPAAALKDRAGAKFSIFMLATCLGMLTIAPIFDLDMGIICLICAFIMMGKDAVYDYRIRKHEAMVFKKPVAAPEPPPFPKVVPAPNAHRRNFMHHNLRNSRHMPWRDENRVHKSSIITAGKRMPWKILPFIIGMFIMVEILGEAGWIDLLASGFASLESTIGPVGSIFFMNFVSSLTCNVMNNQPMTILFTRMLQDPAFITPGSTTRVSMYALIMGSNFGANFTLIGALAGIMWSSISADKGVNIKYKQFAKYGFIIMPAIVAVASLVLAIEFLLGLV